MERLGAAGRRLGPLRLRSTGTRLFGDIIFLGQRTYCPAGDDVHTIETGRVWQTGRGLMAHPRIHLLAGVRWTHRTVAVTVVAAAALVAAITPAPAITGGTEDTANTYRNVGMVVFYQPDGRFRCSGTLVAPRVVPDRGPLHVPGHRKGHGHVRPAHLPDRGGGRARHPARRRRHRPRRRDLGRSGSRRPTSHPRATRASRRGSSAPR